jgi:cellobiose phosphorylase
MKKSTSHSSPGGRFLEGHGFRVTQRQLPRRWDYLLAGPGGVARFCQNGLVTFQANPPAGRFLLEGSLESAVPPLVVWIHDGQGEPFTHVFSPTFAAALTEPESYNVDYLGNEVIYTLDYRGWVVRTVVHLDPQTGELLGRVTLQNKRKTKRRARIVLAAATLNALPGRQAWDPVGLYQRAEVLKTRDLAGVVVENRHPEGEASKRASMAVAVHPAPEEIEADRSVFIGSGAWSCPQFVTQPGKGDPHRQIHGVETVAAFAWTRDLAGGKCFQLAFAAGVAASPAPRTVLPRIRAWLGAKAWQSAARRMEERQAVWEKSLVLQSPDPVLDDYVNVWLPRQLSWVALLDRGWATGLRGVRDAAQDYTAVAWIEPRTSREMLRLLFSAQRKDGWFPRQVALPGGNGRHDLRPYVDSGCWVVELLHDYLRVTGDRTILREPLPWLEGDGASTVSAHLQRAAEYYLDPKNRGPHDLVLIRGGDWNDAVHLAGLAGSGESVMTSCQAVVALRQAADILQTADKKLADRYCEESQSLRLAIRKAALNDLGFLRGVSTDDGRWIFSERDPDGQERINTAVQAWGIIAGVLDVGESRRLLNAILQRLGPHGIRLFHPPLGEPPVPGVGRVASGDLMAGVAENGTVYNHGSQTFLARAAAAVGDGDSLMTILRWALPCYPELHPPITARTPPYAMVNCWMETPGHDGEGGALFLTGAVGVLRRVVIEGLLGFVPGMDGIRIRPCLPGGWRGCRYSVRLRGREYDVSIGNGAATEPLFVPWASRRRHLVAGSGGSL